MYATTEALNCSAANRQIRLHYTKDTTWYGGKPRPRPHCVRWGHSSPKRGTNPQFSAHVYCGQTVAHLSYC